MIYVGIDDTDILGSPGTNKLARLLLRSLPPEYESVLAIRHQLLFDRRIPYTSKNSSASLLLRSASNGSVDELASRIRRVMQDWFIAGSDPGLCIAAHVPEEITEFGQRCQREVVSQQEARRLAARHDIHLEGLGGSEDGVIGALAAVGLAAGGEDGRVVGMGAWPDDLAGPQDIGLLRDRGVAEIRCLDTDRPINSGVVDVGKHLRPSYRAGRVVLFVRAAPEGAAQSAPWQSVRFT